MSNKIQSLFFNENAKQRKARTDETLTLKALAKVLKVKPLPRSEILRRRKEFEQYKNTEEYKRGLMPVTSWGLKHKQEVASELKQQ